MIIYKANIFLSEDNIENDQDMLPDLWWNIGWFAVFDSKYYQLIEDSQNMYLQSSSVKLKNLYWHPNSRSFDFTQRIVLFLSLCLEAITERGCISIFVEQFQE